jgi:hypothetical protein
MMERDDIQRDLQVLLVGANPSSAFAAGVRTGVAEDAARRSRRTAVAWALGGAACLASLVWALTARRPAVASVASAPVMVSATLAGPQRPVALSPLGARTERPRNGRRAGVDVPPPAAADAVALSAASVDARVLVPDDQRIALVHLLLRLHQGRATVPASIVPAYDKDGLLLPPEPVVITLLPNPAPPDPDLEDAGGGKADPRKAGRDK